MSRALIFDYKSGIREVADAEINLQAWAYVLGVFQKFPDVEVVEFTFLVPNRDEVLSHTFKRSDAPDMQLRINTVIRRAMEIDWSEPNEIDESLLNPQSELCIYCAQQTSCPALARKALIVANKLSPGLPVPDTLAIDNDTAPEDIAAMLRLSPLIEAWAKGVRAAALRANLEEGVEIPGFARVERSTERSVTSVLGAWEAVKDQIPLEDFLGACAGVSVVQLEDYFANMVKKGKGKARAELNNRLIEASVLNESGVIRYLKENKK